jgi:hypothetical protein
MVRYAPREPRKKKGPGAETFREKIWRRFKQFIAPEIAPALAALRAIDSGTESKGHGA